MLDDAGARPITLLVVPHYHYRARVLGEPAFVRAMDARLARGDELALHGYFHLDDARPPRTLRTWFARRIRTRTEGEFAALDEHASAWRLVRGIALFERLGWPLAGFMPPAWLLSGGARSALAHCAHRFEYVTVRDGIYHLPEWRFERTANLCYSPDTAMRRAMSKAAIGHEWRRARGVGLMRLSLHPQDVRAPQVLRHWRRLVGDALALRTAVTKREWVRRIRALPAPDRHCAQPRFVPEVEDARVSDARVSDARASPAAAS